jgi:hypothetical protein
MPKGPRRYRLAWEDRFAQPSVNDLRDPFPKDLERLIDDARAALLAMRGLKEHILWQGIPWRWSMAFQCRKDDDIAWAYIVPDPHDGPCLALPMTTDCREQMLEHELPSKAAREHLTKAKQANGSVWTDWRFTTERELEEALEVVSLKQALTEV